jgi:hypothetical protein
VKGLKAFCSLSDYFGDARFQSKELGPAALRQLLIFYAPLRPLSIKRTRACGPQTAFDFLRATAACVYFPKYSNIVRKNLSTAQFGFLQFFMGHDTRRNIKNMFRLIFCWVNGPEEWNVILTIAFTISICTSRKRRESHVN